MRLNNLQNTEHLFYIQDSVLLKPVFLSSASANVLPYMNFD